MIARLRHARSHAKSPELAATLSFWLPGLGQLYAAAWARGLLVLVGSGVLSALAWEDASPLEIWAGEWPAEPVRAGILWGLSIVVWIWSIRDASRAAR